LVNEISAEENEETKLTFASEIFAIEETQW